MSAFLDLSPNNNARNRYRRGRTPCSARSSLESGADMMTRRTEDGAAKWALCALRDEMETTALLADHRGHRR